MDKYEIDRNDIDQLVKKVASGNAPGSNALLRRMARKYHDPEPRLTEMIVDALRASPLRSISTGQSLDLPTDSDSRVSLVREEDPVTLLNEPILSEEVSGPLEQIVQEHRMQDALNAQGLTATRTGLLIGAPGVGKTLGARWVARELDAPLLTLDLSAVMSSFLGRTGANVRSVLDYAKSKRCVLLLDELDAVAKRRDDASEIGELKRLVTVILQEVDSWPAGSLLLAATNHVELLDPAIWRRFEVVVRFSEPDVEALKQGVIDFIAEPELNPEIVELIAQLYAGETLSTLERDLLRARRVAVVRHEPIAATVLETARGRFSNIPATDRGRAAATLVEHTSLSQRAVSEFTKVSRDTIRKNVGLRTNRSRDGK